MSGTGKHLALWQGWSARFAALQRREKLVVCGAVVFVVLFGAYALWIEPAGLEKTRLENLIAQHGAEQAQLAARRAELAAQSADPDAANRSALAELERRMAVAEEEIRGFDRLLMPPSQAPALLQALLARHRGLTLVSLATLAPQPLVTLPKDAAAPASPVANAAAPAAPAAGNLYKHGIEIRISGRYHDLLAYVAELESGQQKLIWGAMSLSSNYPLSELHLTVYTLSLESTWLVV